jgi:glycosyltransferase involved in cell wall biosynthesis
LTPGRIAYLVSEYPHIRHAYLLREIRGLRQLGWEIDALAIRAEARASGVYTAEEREERAACFYVLGSGWGRMLAAHLTTLLRHPAGYGRGFARALGFGPRGIFYFAEAVIAGRYLESRRIQHLHTHYASSVAWLLGGIFPIGVSMSIHGSGEFDDPRTFRLTEKIAAAQFIRAISFFGRSQLLRACPYENWDKIEICRLGVPGNFGEAGATERPPRDIGGRFHLLCVGGMATPRSFQVLLGALALTANSAISLTLVGDGPDRPLLERLAAECGLAGRVRFEGWKTQDELQAIYAAADAFVFSSFAEGIPVALMEAMAMGLPCVAPWLAGIPELIRDGVDGLLTAPSDERGMADCIERLYRDAELCRQLGASARARVLELYNLDRNIPALGEMFRARLTTRRG